MMYKDSTQTMKEIRTGSFALQLQMNYYTSKHSSTMSAKVYDALIIGGGPAGLAMATSLARQVYSTLVIDSGEYRNARAQHMHTVPGFDHADPAVFRAKVRGDLARRYDCVEFRAATVTRVRRLDSGVFEALDDTGRVYLGKKLGLGTGVRDVFDDQPEGYDECWARGM